MKILAILILFLSFWSSSQQPSYFMFAEKEFEGVDIYDVIQDNLQNYWFATDQGIYKHDGYSFVKIECEEMKSSSVFNFVKDSRGVIYCNNLNYQVFKIENDKCTLFLDLPKEGKKSNIALALTKDDDILTYSEYAYLFDRNGKLLDNSNRYKGNYLLAAFKQQNGEIIIHESGTLNLLVVKNRKFEQKKINLFNDGVGLDGLEFFRLNHKTFAIDKFKKRLFSYNEENLNLIYVKTLPAYLHPQFLRFYPQNKNIWIASSIAGVTVLDENLNFRFQKEEIYEDYFISDIFTDSEGNTLVSTFDKGVLVIPELKVSDVVPELTEYGITRIASNDKGTLYFGGNNGQILSYQDGKVLEINQKGVKVIEMLGIWKNKDFILFDDQGISIYDNKLKTKKSFKSGSMKDFTEVNENELFIGFNVGVFKYKYKDKLKEFQITEITELEGRVNAIVYEKKSKYLYVATNEGLKFRKGDGKVDFMHFGEKILYVIDFALKGDTVIATTRKNGILFIKNGQVIKQIKPSLSSGPLEIFKIQFVNRLIYANTNVGLVIISLKGEIVQILNKAVGISMNKIIDFYIGEKYIWIAHARGVQKIEHKFVTNFDRRPNLILSQVFSNNSQVSELSKQQKKFSFSDNKFRFVLKVPTLKSRDNLQYHYKLAGNDENWSKVSYSQNEITYNALAPGKYIFIAKAENNGVFSKTITYEFTILSPFYLRWWFFLSVFLVGFLLLTLLYRWKLMIEKRKSQQVNELNASKLTAIQSQMNPHFIFNSLNSIQDLVLKGDVDNSYTFITKFSNLVRRTLSYSEKDFIEFDQEIKLLELYLSLEKLRFKEDFEFVIDTNEIEDILIPPMLIQPFIENALLHGLLHKEGLKKLKIRFKLDDVLICEIKDNGVGRKKSREIKERQKSEHESFAVQAIKKRFSILKSVFKEEIGFEYFDLGNEVEVKGTRVVLKIPVKIKY